MSIGVSPACRILQRRIDHDRTSKTRSSVSGRVLATLRRTIRQIWASGRKPLAVVTDRLASWSSDQEGRDHGHRGNPTAETPAAVVRAHSLACSSSALQAQWRPLSVDHVEQARLGALRLTTVGRKSGQERSVIIGYVEDGPNLVVLAMNGWDEGHPRGGQPRGAPGCCPSPAGAACAPGVRLRSWRT